MTDTIIVSSKPRNKSFSGYKLRDIFYDTKKTTPTKSIKLADDEWLWTGESAYCICNHHETLLLMRSFK